MDLIDLKKKIEDIPGVIDGGVSTIRVSVDPIGMMRLFVTTHDAVVAKNVESIILDRWTDWNPGQTTLPVVSVMQNVINIAFMQG